MNDEISKYSGVADSYKSFPLSALRHMQSILEFEIEQRLLEFGITNVEKTLCKLADVEGKQTVFNGQNNVVIGNFSRGNE